MSYQAAKELEDAAAKYAGEAIKLDLQGSYGLAIQYYQRAISTLIKLCQLYPEYRLNQLYLQRAMQYQERVKALQKAYGLSFTQEGPELQPRAKEAPPTEQTMGEEAPAGLGVEPLKSSFSDLVVKEKPNVSWDEVIGLDDVKKMIRESIVYPTRRPDLFPLGWPRGILLFGPPGCGKTLICAAAAAELNAYFISVDAASIMSKWLGEAEKNVARLFSFARKLHTREEGRPVIIFIDEIDSLLGVRSQEVGGEVRVRNQFLKELDGVQEKGKNSHLYVIGATNKPWALDVPFLRRFQKRVLVPPPDQAARRRLFELYTRPLRLDADASLEELAKLTEGYTGSDIRDICQAVQLKVVSELFESGVADDPRALPRPIALRDFKEVIGSRKPSITPEIVRAYQAWAEAFGGL
ncbi:MAG: AAA family ATPase [Nitrososphaerota archaeon]